MGHVGAFEQQMPLLNLANLHITKVEKLEEEELKKILNINLLLHSQNKDKYESSLDPSFTLFLLNRLASTIFAPPQTSAYQSHSNPQKGSTIPRYTLSTPLPLQGQSQTISTFLSLLSSMRPLPANSHPAVGSLVLNHSILPSKCRLNIIKALYNNNSNYNWIIGLLRLGMMGEYCRGEGREDSGNEVQEICSLLVNCISVNEDIKKEVREGAKGRDSRVYSFFVELLNKRGNQDTPFDQNLFTLIKLACSGRSLRELELIFNDKKNVETFIRTSAESSSNKELKKLFSTIYSKLHTGFISDLTRDYLDEDPDNPTPRPPVSGQINRLKN